MNGKIDNSRIDSLKRFSFAQEGELFARYGTDGRRRTTDLLQIAMRGGDNIFEDESGAALLHALDALGALGQQYIDTSALEVVSLDESALEDPYSAYELERVRAALLATPSSEGERALMLRAIDMWTWEALAEDSGLKPSSVRAKAQRSAVAFTEVILGGKLAGCGEFDKELPKLIYGLCGDRVRPKEQEQIEACMAHLNECATCNAVHTRLMRALDAGRAFLSPLEREHFEKPMDFRAQASALPAVPAAVSVPPPVVEPLPEVAFTATPSVDSAPYANAAPEQELGAPDEFAPDEAPTVVEDLNLEPVAPSADAELDGPLFAIAEATEPELTPELDPAPQARDEWQGIDFEWPETGGAAGGAESPSAAIPIDESRPYDWRTEDEAVAAGNARLLEHVATAGQLTDIDPASAPAAPASPFDPETLAIAIAAALESRDEKKRADVSSATVAPEPLESLAAAEPEPAPEIPVDLYEAPASESSPSSEARNKPVAAAAPPAAAAAVLVAADAGDADLTEASDDEQPEEATASTEIPGEDTTAYERAAAVVRDINSGGQFPRPAGVEPPATKLRVGATAATAETSRFLTNLDDNEPHAWAVEGVDDYDEDGEDRHRRRDLLLAAAVFLLALVLVGVSLAPFTKKDSPQAPVATNTTKIADAPARRPAKKAVRKHKRVVRHKHHARTPSTVAPAPQPVVQNTPAVVQQPDPPASSSVDDGSSEFLPEAGS